MSEVTSESWYAKVNKHRMKPCLPFFDRELMSTGDMTMFKLSCLHVLSLYRKIHSCHFHFVLAMLLKQNATKTLSAQISVHFG